MEVNDGNNPGAILHRMGVEVAPDDPRSAQEILNQINRNRIENNIIMEPDAEVREKMAAFALKTYPLESDVVPEIKPAVPVLSERVRLRKRGSPYFA